MIEDTTSVADDAAAACLQAIKDDQAEVIILGCTIIGAALSANNLLLPGRHRELPILNPNLLVLKAADAGPFTGWASTRSAGWACTSGMSSTTRSRQEVRRRWYLADRARGVEVDR